MAIRYYIANNAKYYSFDGEVDNISEALRMTHSDAEHTMLEEKRLDRHWIIRKAYNSSSKKNYVLSTLKFFVLSKGVGRTCDMNEALSFRSISDAKSWMENHDVRKILDDYPCIVNSQFAKVYTPDELIAPRARIKKSEREEIYEASDKKCAICGKPLTLQECTIDHIVPRSRGGENNIDNYRILCPACNHFKSDRLDSEMYENVIDIIANKMSDGYDEEISKRLIRCIVRGYLSVKLNNNECDY